MCKKSDVCVYEKVFRNIITHLHDQISQHENSTTHVNDTSTSQVVPTQGNELENQIHGTPMTPVKIVESPLIKQMS